MRPGGAVGRDEVLRRRSDFRRVYDEGTSLRSADVVLVFFRRGGEEGRHAVVASRKVGRAVQRNRAKRLLREAHRHLRPEGGFGGVDIVLIARHTAPAKSGRLIAEQLLDLYRRAGLIAPPEEFGEPTDS